MLVLLFLLYTSAFASISDQIGALAICAQGCITSAIFQCGCSVANFTCACQCATFKPFSGSCLVDSCAADRVSAALNTISSICAVVNPTPTPQSASSSTTTSSSKSSLKSTSQSITLISTSNPSSHTTGSSTSLTTSRPSYPPCVGCASPTSSSVWNPTSTPIWSSTFLKTPSPLYPPCLPQQTQSGSFSVCTNRSWSNMTGTYCASGPNQTCLPTPIQQGAGAVIVLVWPLGFCFLALIPVFL